MKKGQPSFTLTELLMVIGILADVVLPAYKTYTDKAKFSGRVHWAAVVTPRLFVNT